MGLSSKQVSNSGIDWNQTLLQDRNLELPKPPLMRKLQQQQQQQQQQQRQQSQQSSEPLKCPRCDSTNTKFCYYNNYNKSQPRHFCRTCKRHWTKGGTLRNVPVGGGRKNKRVKKSSTPNSSTTAAAAVTTSTSGGGGLNTHMTIQTPLQRQSTLPLPSSSASLYQSLIHPPPQQALLPHQNLMNPRDLQSKDFGVGVSNGNGSFLSSTLPLLPQNQSFVFPFSSSSSFETNPCSVSTSLRSSNVYNNNYGEELKKMEEPTPTQTQPWEMPSTSAGNMEMSSYWSWEDIDSLVSTDLNVPWDDSDLKP